MSASFDETLPDDLNRVRAAIADRGSIVDRDGSVVWLRQNQEIESVLDRPLDWRLAAAEIGTFLAVELAQKVDSYTDENGMSVRWSQRVSTLLAMAKMMREQVAAETIGGGGAGSARVQRFEDIDMTGEYRRRVSRWVEFGGHE